MAPSGRHKTTVSSAPVISPEHYLRVILHRWWIVVITFVVITAGTIVYTSRLPDIYTSTTLIQVDAQKVPEAYVKSTVTGDVGSRLSTLSTQILSASRLQKIIDSLNLYPKERREQVSREDLINKMRSSIGVSVVSELAGGPGLQAFKISFSGQQDPQLVARVANELASLFIDENMKAREQQATGTTEFLQNQLQQTLKDLDQQESKLRDFRMKHIGEMPEQQVADLQLLGHLQAQFQQEGDALARAEQQRSVFLTMMEQPAAPVVDMDPAERPAAKAAAEAKAAVPAASPLAALRARLAALQERYGDRHPEIRKVKAAITEQEAKEAQQLTTVAETKPVETVAAKNEPALPALLPAANSTALPARTINPVLQTNLRAVEAEILKHKEQRQKLNKQIAGYQAKLEAIPIREQEVTNLVRNYDMAKAHYAQLLDKQYSAETATQLEIRQKGEKFTTLDPALPPEKPSSPNRLLLNLGGSGVGLGLGLLLAIISEFVGMVITSPEQIIEMSGIPVLEVIPVIQTHKDRRVRKKRLVWVTASCLAMAIVSGGAVLLYHFRS